MARDNRRTVDRSPWASRVDPTDVMTLSFEDLDNPYNRYTLLMSPLETLSEWLQRNSLLADSMRCDRCNTDCTLTARSRALDDYTWRCPQRHEITTRRNSFFSNSHMLLPDILNFIMTYSEGHSLFRCAHSSSLAYANTAVDWANYCRDLCIEFFVRDISPVKLSGIVEVLILVWKTH